MRALVGTEAVGCEWGHGCGAHPSVLPHTSRHPGWVVEAVLQVYERGCVRHTHQRHASLDGACVQANTCVRMLCITHTHTQIVFITRQCMPVAGMAAASGAMMMPAMMPAMVPPVPVCMHMQAVRACAYVCACVCVYMRVHAGTFLPVGVQVDVPLPTLPHLCKCHTALIQARRPSPALLRQLHCKGTDVCAANACACRACRCRTARPRATAPWPAGRWAMAHPPWPQCR